MAEIFFFADSFIAFFNGNCKAPDTELTGVSHRSSLVGVQAAHMGLAGLDQIQQAATGRGDRPIEDIEMKMEVID